MNKKRRIISCLSAVWVACLVLFWFRVNSFPGVTILTQKLTDGDFDSVSRLISPEKVYRSLLHAIEPTNLSRTAFADWVHERPWIVVSHSRISTCSALKGLFPVYVLNDTCDPQCSSLVFSQQTCLESLLVSEQELPVVFVVPTGVNSFSGCSATLESAMSKKFIFPSGSIDFGRQEVSSWVASLILRAEQRLKRPWALIGLKLDHPSNPLHADAAAWSSNYYYSFFDFGRKKWGFDFVAEFKCPAVGEESTQPIVNLHHENTDDHHGRLFEPHDISFVCSLAEKPTTLKAAVASMLKTTELGYINVGFSSIPLSPLRETLSPWWSWVHIAIFTPKIEFAAFDGCESFPIELYRFVDIHAELTPYFLSLASTVFFTPSKASNTQASLNHPFVVRRRSVHDQLLMGMKVKWENIDEMETAFLLGFNIFVHPLDGSSDAVLQFPSFGSWILYEQIYEKRREVVYFAAGSKVPVSEISRNVIPAFRRRGAIFLQDFLSSMRLLFPNKRDELTAMFPRLPVLSTPSTNTKKLRDYPLVVVIEHPTNKVRRRHPNSTGLESVPREISQYFSAFEEPFEFAYTFGEHDNGVLAYYTVQKLSDATFSINLRLTPYPRPILVIIRGVKCHRTSSALGQRRHCMDWYHDVQNAASPYALVSDIIFSKSYPAKDAAPSEVRGSAVDDDFSLWLFDPFAMTGMNVTFQPLEPL